MRRFTWLFTAAILLASSVLPAAAQSACPGVCITYSSPVGVPLSPTLTLLLTIVLGGSGYFFLRRKNHGFLAAVLASTLGIFSMVMNSRESVATPSYQVVLTTGNYAEVTLPSGFSGPVSVRNTQSFTVVIAGITVGSGFSIDPSSTLTVGTQIPAWGTVNSAVVIAAPPNTPPVPTFTGFTTDASLSMNYSGQLTATDANGDTLTYTLQTAPSVGTLSINPNGSFTFSGSVMPGSYSFTYTVKDAGVPVAKTATITINDVAPVAGGAFAGLTDMTTDDNAGVPITPISAGGVTDPLGRTITYSATGLPSGVTIDPNSGTISGAHDVIGNISYTVTVTAQNPNGVSISKTFVLTLRDVG